MSDDAQGGGAMPASRFVISLDFELMWGIFSDRSIEDYGDAIRGGREAIPKILSLFREHNIRATWATVGLLFFETKSALKRALPDRRPSYASQRMSPYPTIDDVGLDEASDPYHFGRSLIGRIADTPGQEVGTHTFSHFFCLEKGASLDEFRSDMAAACDAAARCDVALKSIVFPRDQWAWEHVNICANAGIHAFRGNPSSYIYRPMRRDQRNLIVRGLRAVDGLMPTGIDTTHQVPSSLDVRQGATVNVPSSRFLRVPPGGSAAFATMHLNRIFQEMEGAARGGRLYHLWWHPHNFGRRQDLALGMLARILRHFEELRDRYGMISSNMGDWLEQGTWPVCEH